MAINGFKKKLDDLEVIAKDIHDKSGVNVIADRDKSRIVLDCSPMAIHFIVETLGYIGSKYPYRFVVDHAGATYSSGVKIRVLFDKERGLRDLTNLLNRRFPNEVFLLKESVFVARERESKIEKIVSRYRSITSRFIFVCEQETGGTRIFLYPGIPQETD
jgi:hypothetical protein